MVSIGATWWAAPLAFLASASWLIFYRTATTSPLRRVGLVIGAWAGWSGWVTLVSWHYPSVPAVVPVLVAVLGLGLGWLGISAMARAVVVEGSWAQSLADACLTAVCVVAMFWGTLGAEQSPSAQVVSAVRLITDVTVAALLLRALQPRGPLVIDQRFRNRLIGAAVVSAGFATTDAIASLMEAGGSVPVLPARVTTTVAYLALAVTPWLPEPRPTRVARPNRAPRGVPYGMIIMATPALLYLALRHGLGPVLPVTLTVGVSCLAISQGLALRENARLSSALEYHQVRMSALVENSGDVILGLDPLGRVATVNPAAMHLFARSPEGLIGQPIASLAVAPERAALQAELDDVVSGRQGAARIEVTLDAPAAGTVELRLRAIPGGAVANLSDVTDAVQLRERLARLARRDQLTGLANRWSLESELTAWLAQGRHAAVLFVDLDGFKGLNDRFGHLAGDQVLTTVADRLTSGVFSLPGNRPLVARFGGDEFVLALPDVGLDIATTVARQVLSVLRPPFAIADRSVQIQGSLGIAATDDGAPRTAAADLLHRADVAMFAAKQAGAGHLQVWTSQVEERAVRRVDIAIGLRGALDTGRLALAYQPIVRLSDGVIIGAEALIRLAATDAESIAPGALSSLAALVTPAELVEVAEDTGAIDELGRWVLSEATHQAALWRAMSCDVQVNVNMSVRQLSDPSFSETVHAALMAARLPPDRLAVEITEGQLLSAGSPAELTARRLRELGVHVVIDDFGSGYSSMGYLSRLPVTGVKIDKSLLDQVDVDRRARLVLRAVIGLAVGLGLTVVCEGIELASMARLVRDLGAHAGQGFAFHGALSAEDLREVLDRSSAASGIEIATGRTIDLTSRDGQGVRLTPPSAR